MFDDKYLRLLNALEDAHDAYYRRPPFSGPSGHFRRRSLNAARAWDRDLFTESAYAMLASWGMHRMGRGGSKMRDVEDFSDSLKSVWSFATNLRGKKPTELTVDDWNNLKRIFCGIRCMASRTSLVGNSKVMAHLLPDLIPPVDRQYTLRFLYGSKAIKNDIENEWTRLSEILQHFFYRVVDTPAFQVKAIEWMAKATSTVERDIFPLKLVDNLIIGLVIMDRDN